MIKLDRDRGEIKVGFRGQRRINRERKLLDQHLAGEAPSSSIWKTAKKQLKVESHGKCAYCEGKADHVAHGDVEHFRPKSVYWWLAYCYDNYTYSCQICNQSFKSANFPTTHAALPEPIVPANPTTLDLDALAGSLAPDPANAAEVGTFVGECAAEKAHIPDPYVIDPEPLFSWTADDVLREVEVKPRTGSPEHQRVHAAAVTLLGLNRDELRRWRYLRFDIARTFVDVLSDGGISAATRQRIEDQLRLMMDASAEFAGMVRYFVRVESGLQL